MKSKNDVPRTAELSFPQPANYFVPVVPPMLQPPGAEKGEAFCDFIFFRPGYVKSLDRVKYEVVNPAAVGEEFRHCLCGIFQRLPIKALQDSAHDNVHGVIPVRDRKRVGKQRFAIPKAVLETALSG